SGIVQLPADVQVSAIGDFRSNLPFSPSTSLDLNLDGYTGDLPAGVLPGTGCRDLNLDAINTFRAGRGLAAVSGITCSNFMNVDIRLSKSIRLPQNHRLELIAQLFNAANRANFQTPTTSLTSAAFGQATRILDFINAPSRQVEFAVRYQF
ncbi:MAG: hypothetical protein HYZ58_10420, partial [Acidobacteria bacterium]|nr:hypothetical protein [Acidobacteriota bacterium]